MKKLKRLCWLMVAVFMMSCIAVPVEALAAQNSNNVTVETYETTYIDVFFNPVHEGRIDKEKLGEENRKIQEYCLGGEVLYAGNNQFSTIADAVTYMRAQMVARESSITVAVPSAMCTSTMWNNLFNEAKEHYEGCSGQEGDTLYWSWTSASGSISSGGGYNYYTYNLTYDTTYAQEQQLTAKVNEALASMKLTNKSQFEKIKAIYTYICDNVNYDYTYERHAAYDAMIEGSAVCEGYAMLFYRMALDSGLSARLVSGKGNGGAHGWNIVKIGDVYYNLDATWDGQDDETRSNYFLKNEEDFVNHVRDERYNTAEFHKQYPMTKESWVDVTAFAPALNMNNLSYTFTGMDGKTYSSAANQKNKLLIFYNATCSYSKSTVKAIANSDITGVDIIAMNANEEAESSNASFISEYGSSKIKFMKTCNETSNYWAMWQYVWESGWDYSIYYPVIIYVDVNNKMQLMTNGKQSAGDVKARLNYYCTATLPALKIETQPATVTVNQDTNASFNVKASGTGLSYQWQFSKDGGKTWANSTITGAKTASITVQGTLARNGYMYRCVVKDSIGKTVTSNGATLNVKALVSITGQPISQTVTEGNSVTFKVTASGSNLTYQWQYQPANSTAWYNSSAADAKTASLKVEGKASRNGQKYRCVVKNASGIKVTSNVVTLTVKAPSIVITGQPASQTVTEGNTATFKITASGTGLSYQWQYQPAGDTNWYNSSAATAKTASLKVEGKASRNGQKYRCVLKDSTGYKITSKGATLTVKAPAVVITTQPANQSVATGKTATFKVVASGSNLSYQWQYQPSGSTSWFNSSATTAKTASLNVEGKTSRNGQKYRCVVKDSSGYVVTSKGATLTVTAPSIVITGQPANQSVAAGKTATFKVTASGKNLTYQWQYQPAGNSNWYNSSATTAKTASISVEGKTSRNGQQYRCVIKDDSGYYITSSAAKLTVK